MKSSIFISMLMACSPFLLMAQSNDDLYFVPKKEKKTATENRKAEPARQSNTTVYAAPGSTVVVKDVSGKTRDIDEYNRRYTARDNTFKVENDTLYIEEKPYGERGEWVNGFEGSQDDYEYAMRIVRFRSPRYAIPVSSPLYWDVVYGYGAFNSWDWNVYDDGMYAYIFPTFSNPLWWDWRWNWSVAGPRWGYGWGWHSPWYYSSWYSPYWYGGGYWAGYWGPGWGPHHHHPYYGGVGGIHRPGYTDYRPSRYEGAGGNRYVSAGRSGGTNRYTCPSGTASSQWNNTRPGGTSGRVVNPGSNAGGSVRPSGTNSTMRRGSATSTVENARPARGNYSGYVRPSSTIDRTGSSYDRPSSTRRSVNYNRGNSSSSYNNSSRSSGSNRGTISSGGGGFSRGSMGGSSSRGAGGSSRRR